MEENSSEIDFKRIESKWQTKWEEAKLFEAKDDSDKKKYYVLEMFPYPSGDGLHMGHALNYVIGDVLARFKMMQGFNVLHPMGYDALGLPAENAAIKDGTHPEDYTNKAIANYINQQKSLGITYDWSRVVNTADPSYYKWDQWIFLKMLEKGLAYQKESEVNYCSKCDTVLANEQVQNGVCWRHEDTQVEIKNLKQWFFKITDYASELYDSIDDLSGWPEKTKAMQRNWIGKKQWIDITYDIDGSSEKVVVSTTRPDTNFGATFIVMAPEHKLLSSETGLVPEERQSEVDKYIKEAKAKSKEERISEGRKKTGVFTGLYAMNPLTEKRMPVWVTDFVLADVGTGAVVGVPAHDKRDFEFAKEYGLEIIRVVKGASEDTSEITDVSQVQEEQGTMINSGFLDGMDIHDATTKVMDYMEEKGYGKRTFRYRLRDWGVSRQRYWGTPIPIIHCEKCGAVPVPENDLPVKLPKDVTFGKGNPLETAEDWLNVPCPKCGENAKRETDTMDTFVNSSWYFLRYCDANNDSIIFDTKKANNFCPIDQYIGGSEHACMHLIYFRYYTKFLADLGLINFREPAVKMFHQGMLHGEGGIKMSKSKGNVVNPDSVSETYGIDTARYFLLSLAEPDKKRDWSEAGIQGSLRFVKRMFETFENINVGKSTPEFTSKVHKGITDITTHIESFRYRMATISLKELFDTLSKETQASKEDLEICLKLLNPFCPHISEELWEKIGCEGFASVAQWPKVDESKIQKKGGGVDINEQVIHKVQEILNKVDGSKVILYVMPFEKDKIDTNKISEAVGKEVTAYAVNDPKKEDPENKAKQAKPGSPSVFVVS